MHLTLKVIVFAVLVFGTECADDGYGELDDEPFDDDNDYDYDHENSSELEQIRPLLDKLYGSEEAARDKFWKKYEDLRPGNRHLGKAWVVDELRQTIESKDQNGALSGTEKESLLSAVDKDLQRLLNYSAENYDPDCEHYFKLLQHSRSHLDCALGRDVVTDYVTKADNSEPCWNDGSGVIRELWNKTIDALDSAKDCSERGMFSDLVRIAQAGFLKDRPTQNENLRMNLSANLVETLSKRHRLKYLTRITCGEGKSPGDCFSVINIIGDFVCKRLAIANVEGLEKLMTGQSVGSSLSSPDDMKITMDILSEVAETVDQLSKSNLQGQTRTATRHALDLYLQLMDSAIGKSAQRIWMQMADDQQLLPKLQMVLANNEQYVGAMSDIFFRARDSDEEYSATIEKETMELKLFKVPDSNSSDEIDFKFMEAEIKTQPLAGDAANGLNVYAIHYKSWANLLQKQGLNETNSTRNRPKFFVGTGGIISLSARAEDGKRSIPVSYKMKFANSTENVAYCMSCEYLDLTTGAWEKAGCSVKDVDNEGVNCKCNHTTNFAAFMSPVPIDINMTASQREAEKIVSYIGSAVSALALALSLIVFNIVRPYVKNRDRLNAHTNLAFALFVVHAIQLTSDFVIRVDAACLVAAVFTHFFLLVAFFWMLIEGIFLYLYVVQVFIHSATEYLRWLYVLGWLLPALIVVTVAGVGIPRDIYLDLEDLPNYTSPCPETEFLYPPLPPPVSSPKYKSCWLGTDYGMAWSFIAPAMAIILFNTFILIKVFQVLRKISANNRNIRPFQTSSGKKDSVNGFTSKKYVRQDSDVQPIYKTSEALGDEGKKLTEAENGVNGYSCDYRGRFDNSSTSQAYMYNATQSTKISSVCENSAGKYFVDDVRAAAKGAAVLLPILGIPWVCGLWLARSYALLVIFLALNSTQGAVIFIVYCLMNGEVKRALRRHYKVSRLQNRGSRLRSSSTSSLRSLNSRFTRTWRNKSGSDSTSK